MDFEILTAPDLVEPRITNDDVFGAHLLAQCADCLQGMNRVRADITRKAAVDSSIAQPVAMQRLDLRAKAERSLLLSVLEYRDHLTEDQLDVARETECHRVVASQLRRVEVDLNDLDSRL